MSTTPLLDHAKPHPELLAIGIEVALDPARRRHYTPVVLKLADGAVQELLALIAAAKSSTSDEA